MIKRILPVLLLFSCSLYHNKVDPGADNYQGWETVSSLSDIKGVNNSFSRGKAILLSNKCTKADSYDFQIRYEDKDWVDSIFLNSSTNILEISELEMDYSKTLVWRVRGNKGDKNGPWSRKVNFNYLPIEEKNSSITFSNYIYIGIDFSWGNSWDIEYIDGEELLLNSIKDKYYIKESSDKSFEYRVREKSDDYKGFWSPWRIVDGNSGPKLRLFEDGNLLYGEFEISNKQYTEVINYIIDSNPDLLTIRSNGLYKDDDLLLGFSKLNRGYQTAISSSDSVLKVTKGDEDLPLVGITYKGAKEFCNMLNILNGHSVKGPGYRLPSSSEWEEIAKLQPGMNINRNSNSLIDIYDSPSLLGNAWEWCVDDYIIKGGSYKESDDMVFNPDFNGYRGNAYCDDSVGLRVVFDYD